MAGGSCRSNSQPVANQRPCRRAHGPPQRPTDSHLPVHGERSIPASGQDRPLAPCSLPQTLRPATAQVMPMNDDRHFRRPYSVATPRTIRAFTCLGLSTDWSPTSSTPTPPLRALSDTNSPLATPAAPPVRRRQAPVLSAHQAAASGPLRPQSRSPAVNRPESSALAARGRLHLDRRGRGGPDVVAGAKSTNKGGQRIPGPPGPLRRLGERRARQGIQ